MKKVLLLLAVITGSVFTSCSSDDDSSSVLDPSADLIIGTWKISKIVSGGEAQDLGDCFIKTTFTFNENKTVKLNVYDFNDMDLCESEESNGAWKNLGDSTYEFDTLDGEPTDPAKVTFVDNTMIIEDSEVISGEIILIKTTLIKQ